MKGLICVVPYVPQRSHAHSTSLKGLSKVKDNDCKFEYFYAVYG